MISVLALLFGLMIIIEIVFQQRVLMPNFAQLERDDAKTSMKRVQFALKMTLNRLELAAVDWGNWMDVYRFVQAPDPEFLKTNITSAALKQLQINALLIVDLNGNLVAAGTRDSDSNGPLDVDLAAAKTCPRISHGGAILRRAWRRAGS